MTIIGVVFNPRAGHNRANPRAHSRLAAVVGEHGVVAPADTLDALDRVALSFKALGISVLAVSGGDGTAGLVLTHVARVWGDAPLPTLALLRGGTMNTTANACGVPRGRPEALLKGLVERLGRGEALALTPRNTLRAGGRLGFLFGSGVVEGYLREYYAAGEPSPMTAAKVLGRAIGSTFTGGAMIRRMVKPVRCSVRFDDGTEWPERDWLTVAGGTIDQIGLGFRPFHRATERDGVFHLLGIHTGAMGFVGDLPRIWLARGMQPDKATDKLSAGAVITFADGHARYMLDGDLCEGEGGSVELTTGPTVDVATLRG